LVLWIRDDGGAILADVFSKSRLEPAAPSTPTANAMKTNLPMFSQTVRLTDLLLLSAFLASCYGTARRVDRRYDRRDIRYDRRDDRWDRRGY
jgi:hypothetical protein